jgi:diphthamide synthase (EF-2-diphthine--ammonia ligase)
MTSLVLFSGGKDSAMALLQELRQGRKCICLIFAKKGYSQLSDGLETKTDIVASIARGIFGQTVAICQTSDKNYRADIIKCVREFLRKGDIDRVVTGDLNHPDRIINYLRKRLSSTFPNTSFISIGEFYLNNNQLDANRYLSEVLKKMSVRVVGLRLREFSGTESFFLGKNFNRLMINKLKKLGVDPLGEDGEYQTLVVGLKRAKKYIDVKTSVIKKVTGRDRKGHEYLIEDIKKWSLSR